MTEKRKPKSYSKVFKEESVALVTEQGYSVAEAAKAVGVRTNQLYRWKQEQEALKSGSMLNADDKAELLRLRKENKQRRMEKEILKKASVFFAKEFFIKDLEMTYPVRLLCRVMKVSHSASCMVQTPCQDHQCERIVSIPPHEKTLRGKSWQSRVKNDVKTTTQRRL